MGPLSSLLILAGQSQSFRFCFVVLGNPSANERQAASSRQRPPSILPTGTAIATANPTTWLKPCRISTWSPSSSSTTPKQTTHHNNGIGSSLLSAAAICCFRCRTRDPGWPVVALVRRPHPAPAPGLQAQHHPDHSLPRVQQEKFAASWSSYVNSIIF